MTQSQAARIIRRIEARTWPCLGEGRIEKRRYHLPDLIRLESGEYAVRLRRMDGVEDKQAPNWWKGQVYA